LHFRELEILNARMFGVREKKMQRKEKAPDRLIAQAIGGKLNRDTHPGT